MAKKFLSLSLLTVLFLGSVITVRADEPQDSSVSKELLDAALPDETSHEVAGSKKKETLFDRSSKFLTPLEITVEQKDAQAAAQQALMRDAVNKSVVLLLEKSGNSSSQWQVESMLRNFTPEERAAIHAQITVELDRLADIVAQDNAQRVITRNANRDDAVQAGKHVEEIASVKKRIEAEKSFFVHGPVGKDYVYEQVCANKLMSGAVVWASVATIYSLNRLRK